MKTGKNIDKGLYLYCLTPPYADQGISKTIEQGIAFGDSPQYWEDKEIGIIVSEVNLKKYPKKKIIDNLKSDALWAKKNIELHHRVISQVNQTGPVIPLKFGTIFTSSSSLHHLLEEYHTTFKHLLSKLKDKEEWGLKMYIVYEDMKKFILLQKKETGEIDDLWKEFSPGLDWYEEKKVERLIEEQFDQLVDNNASETLELLGTMAEKITINNPQFQMPESKKNNILNIAVLIKKDKVPVLKEKIKKLEKKFKRQGFILVLTGPWPPYNFVEIKQYDKN